MNQPKMQIKLAFITGLREIVLQEIKKYSDLHIATVTENYIFLNFDEDLNKITFLRSISRAFIVARDLRYTPRYISNHKSLLGNLILLILKNNSSAFKTFKISCAGSDSSEVRSIANYIQNTHGLIEKESADLKIHIVKTDGTWELGVELTARPLSSRDYKTLNMGGAMNPTIAFAVNSLCQLEKASSYLNIFSGSATLLIEAATSYPNLKKLVGFDNDKESITLAIQNIKKAGLMRKIQLLGKDIFDNPDLGKFDAITADLPFGMLISRNEDLEILYRTYVSYCQETLNPKGRMAIYTTKDELLIKIIQESNFKIINTFDLELMTAANKHLHPKIFVCAFEVSPR